MTAKVCSTCIYSDGSGAVRLCRLDAPSSILIPGTMPQVPTATWPIVEDTDWCGQYCDASTPLVSQHPGASGLG